MVKATVLSVPCSTLTGQSAPCWVLFVCFTKICSPISETLTSIDKSLPSESPWYDSVSLAGFSQHCLSLVPLQRSKGTEQC